MGVSNDYVGVHPSHEQFDQRLKCGNKSRIETQKVVAPAGLQLRHAFRSGPTSEGEYTLMKFDCNACQTRASMVAARVAKFNCLMRAIGFVLLVPAMLGLATALFYFISTIENVILSGVEAEPVSPVWVAIFVFIGVCSIVAALLGGWLLMTARKVYKCRRCGVIIDRT
jgi:hypothetical protein